MRDRGNLPRSLETTACGFPAHDQEWLVRKWRFEAERLMAMGIRGGGKAQVDSKLANALRLGAHTFTSRMCLAAQNLIAQKEVSHEAVGMHLPAVFSQAWPSLQKAQAVLVIKMNIFATGMALFFLIGGRDCSSAISFDVKCAGMHAVNNGIRKALEIESPILSLDFAPALRVRHNTPQGAFELVEEVVAQAQLPLFLTKSRGFQFLAGFRMTDHVH